VRITVVHNTAPSSSDYPLSYSPDKHQSSDAVYWSGFLNTWTHYSKNL